MHPCVYPQIKDTSTVEHCPDINTAMEDAPVGFGMGESEDAIGCCKDALLAFCSNDDDGDEGGSEDQVDTCMSDNLSFGGVSSIGASHESDSNPAKCSGYGNEEQHAEKEGDEALDLLAHDVDPYEDAMHGNVDGGFHAFLPSKP